VFGIMDCDAFTTLGEVLTKIGTQLDRRSFQVDVGYWGGALEFSTRRLVMTKLGKVSKETRNQKVFPAPEVDGVPWFPM
jgi:hypothetical protein